MPTAPLPERVDRALALIESYRAENHRKTGQAIARPRAVDVIQLLLDADDQLWSLSWLLRYGETFEEFSAAKGLASSPAQ